MKNDRTWGTSLPRIELPCIVGHQRSRYTYFLRREEYIWMGLLCLLQGMKAISLTWKWKHMKSLNLRKYNNGKAFILCWTGLLETGYSFIVELEKTYSKSESFWVHGRSNWKSSRQSRHTYLMEPGCRRFQAPCLSSMEQDLLLQELQELWNNQQHLSWEKAQPALCRWKIHTSRFRLLRTLSVAFSWAESSSWQSRLLRQHVQARGWPQIYSPPISNQKTVSHCNRQPTPNRYRQCPSSILCSWCVPYVTTTAQKLVFWNLRHDCRTWQLCTRS